MKFLADQMLGKLTRWLRMAGHDVVYAGELRAPSPEEDLHLLGKAKEEGRILLTRDVELHRKALRKGIRSLLIRGITISSQLREVSVECRERIEINPERSRCPLCNGRLERKEVAEVRDLLPPKVARSSRPFWRCSTCGKVYWRGRHWEGILRTLSESGG